MVKLEKRDHYDVLSGDLLAAGDLIGNIHAHDQNSEAQMLRSFEVDRSSVTVWYNNSSAFSDTSKNKRLLTDTILEHCFYDREKCRQFETTLAFAPPQKKERPEG